MNMSASNKNMILVFLGLIILVASYFLGVTKMLEEKTQLENEVATLQQRYNELQAKSAKKAEYEAGIEIYNEKYEEKMKEFPATLDQEYTITFVEGLCQSFEFDAVGMDMGAPEQFYILGTSTLASEGEEASADTTEEAAPETQEPVVTADSNICYTASFPIDYEGSYEGIKEVLNYVAGYRYRMTVDTTELTYDTANEIYTGKITLTSYAISGPDRKDDPLNLDIDTGTKNLFTGSESSQGAASGMNKYDENDGAGIASDYDFYVMLNPATSDVSAKSVGQDGKSASQVTSTANEVENLKFDFYEKDGKNYVTYTLGENSYEAEITSPDDVTIYVTSTERKDATDLSGVNVTIANSMSIPVYVKVSGEDATSPRFNVTSKSGKVKVYK